MAATAVEAWDERWATPEGRADWLVPHPAVAALVPVLKARGTQHVLDLGIGRGAAVLLPDHHWHVADLAGGHPADVVLVEPFGEAGGLAQLAPGDRVAHSV